MRRVRLGLGLGLGVVVLAAATWLGGQAWTTADAPSLPEPVSASPQSAPELGGRMPYTGGAAALHSGETLEVPATALAAGRPVVVSLRLGEPSRSEGPLPVRLLAFDGRHVETSAELVPDDPLAARVALEPSWLAKPGRYVVELRTTELTHFPLRRYAVEVR